MTLPIPAALKFPITMAVARTVINAVPWIVAHTHQFELNLSLSVYRSPELRDTDPEYQPVADILAQYRAEVVEHDVKMDPHMYFGRAVWTVYSLTPKTQEG